MSKFTERMGWDEVSHGWKHWIVWFLLVVAVGTAEELVHLERYYNTQWPHLLALAVVLYFLAKWIVGPDKKKKSKQEEQDD